MLLVCCCHQGLAQTADLYHYQDLSHIFYQKQVDSLKKAWVCPAIYKEKATQKQYKEYWDDRTEFLTKAIKDDDYLYETDVYKYLDSLINQIMQANKQLIPAKPLVLIDRSSAVNAYAIGGNILAVNLGLVTFSRSREDLALTIAHELSHNILLHAENAMKQRAEWITSDAYKASMNAVLDSKYERLTRLKKIFEGYSFSRSRHQRYHERDADSLAIILLKKSGIRFDPTFFLRLDSADLQYKQPLKQPMANYFTAYNITIDNAWTQKRSKGLSTRAYNFKDTTSHLQDSLKTHPECVERYNKTLAARDPDSNYTPIPAAIRQKALKMQLWNMYMNMNLTACMYSIMLEKDNGATDPWYDFMAANVISGLYYADRDLSRFNAVGVTPKEFISKDYYELQTMFEQIPREKLEELSNIVLTNHTSNSKKDEAAFQRLMQSLTTGTDISQTNKTNIGNTFIRGNENSLYAEFAHKFDKP